jgi:HlyD family secretion protein
MSRFFCSPKQESESYILTLVKGMAHERTQMHRGWLWLAVVVVLLVVFFTARSLFRQRLAVRAAEIRHEVIVNTVSTNGLVEPVRPYQFYSPLATTVQAVYVQPGDQVTAGKLLIALNDVDAQARLASAQSGVTAAQASLEAITHNGTQEQRQAAAAEVAQDRLARNQAQQDLDALTKLAATGAASPGEVAAARQRLQVADASLSAAEQSSHSRYSPNEIARARAAVTDAEAALTAARQVEAQTKIYAPINGTVYSMDAAPSEFEEQGKLILQMADLKRERVRAYFDEPEIGQLAVGQQILIRWDAKPGRVWNGHIVRVPVTVITYGTRRVGEVLVAIDESDAGLLPDTNVTVQVTISSQPNALSCPRAALYSENGQYYVYQIVNGELKRNPVTIGTPTLTQVPILSGLKQGDLVATGTENGQPLQQGVPIRVEQ